MRRKTNSLELDTKGCTLVFLALDADRSAVSLYDLADDGQSQPERGFASRAGAHYGICGEELSCDVFRNTDAFVADGNDSLVVLAMQFQRDGGACGTELDGIVKKVDDDPPQLVVIGGNHDRLAFKMDRLTFLCRLELKCGDAYPQ